jgi:peptide/nickel transport system permease protein
LPITQASPVFPISNGFQILLSGRYWTSICPGIALMLNVVAINLVGDQVGNILNPRRSR